MPDGVDEPVQLDADTDDADPDVEQPEILEWDVAAVTRLLTARSETEAEAAWVNALPAISQEFPPDVWGCSHDINPYGPGAHSNLYNTEIRSDFKNWLSANSVSLDRYSEAVGAVQYVSVQIYLNSLFVRARNNRGWRLRIIGFPSLDVIACGLASHYQGTQNHNLMGEASARIRSYALEVLNGETRSALGDWPSATSEHWEERGLMPEPVTHIGDLDISSFDEGGGAKLRMIRNTTVKKELATFFAITGMSAEKFASEGPVLLETLKRIALDLGRTSSQ